MDKNELIHYGVLGMKWGVRRYQPYPKGKKGIFIGENKEIRNPIPKTSFETAIRVLYDSYHNDTYKNNKLEKVPIKNIQTVQDKVFSKKIHSMMTRDASFIKDKGAEIEEILIAKHKKDYVVIDGNHRVASAKMKGDDIINARVYVVDPNVLKVALQNDPDAIKKGRSYVESWLKDKD